MKALTTFFLGILLTTSTWAQKATKHIAYPNSFRMSNTFLTNFIIAPVTSAIKKEIGFSTNPGTTTNPDIIKKLAPKDIKWSGINSIYYQIYQNKESQKTHYAGAIVYRFKNKKTLDQSLGQLQIQSNEGYLVLDHYLIRIWSNDHKNAAMHLERLADYFTRKSGATVIYFKEEKVSDVTEPLTD
ncbi:hypothetical protein DBR32_04465 [Taibaiella sp. KBW10]|uniref:hypothetical protein n=1 Tax=Taibaiella sp. KBW10 TaxID=2153357 RepID=UPI000F5A35B7|nr:hypothetical protein [Taibaiella sp. KBW10]RQO31228.1 hypothetical protein DBR32_04465 [Taibaiella sp. KBW10]